MSDYIKRDDAIKAFDPKQRRDWCTPWIVETLEDLPSADVAPVRRGEWIHPREYGLNLPEHYCSECRAWEYSDVESKFCPNCGARMDGEDDEIDRR